MSDMEYKKFSTFIDSVQYGYTADETSTVEGDAKYLRITDIVPYFVDKDRVPFCKISDKNRIKYLVTENDLLIARTGATTGYNLIVPKGFDNYVFASYLVRFNYNQDELYPQYLKHVLKSQQYYGFVKNYIGGSAQPGMNPKAFGRFEVPHVEYDKQKRIAEILSAYDDLIENNNRRIALLEKAAQELYKEWFVRFRFLGYENAKFENGLPEGWEYIRFGNAIEIIDGDRGVNYPKQEEFYEEGECLFLNAGNVTKNGFDFSSCAYITKEKDQLLRKGKLQTGDVVLTTRGTVGNVAFLNETMTFSPMRINSGMVILRNLGVVSPEYIYTALRHESLQKAMMMYASGSAQPQLPIKDMRRIKINKADAKTMDKFTKYVADIYKQVSLMIMKNQAISKQRDLLLPRLMSGKLEV